MALDATATAVISANNSSIQYHPKITHEQFWVRLPSIPSTIQFRLTHSSSDEDNVISAADIGEAQFVDGDDKAREVVSQLLSSSPLAAQMDYEDRGFLIWEIIDTTSDIIADHSSDETSVIPRIWIVTVEIEQSSTSSYNSDKEDGGSDEGGEPNDAGLHGAEKEVEGIPVKEKEKEGETASSRCAICCEGIPVTWSKDYCPGRSCPSRRLDEPTLCLSVVC